VVDEDAVAAAPELRIDVVTGAYDETVPGTRDHGNHEIPLKRPTPLLRGRLSTSRRHGESRRRKFTGHNGYSGEHEARNIRLHVLAVSSIGDLCRDIK